MSKRVLIRHPRTGHEYAVLPADFRRRKLARDNDGKPITYADAGYRIVSYVDGSPYQPPKSDG